MFPRLLRFPVLFVIAASVAALFLASSLAEQTPGKKPRQEKKVQQSAVVAAESHAAQASLLAKAAVDAVKQWKFTPATLKGMPVAVWIVVPVSFRLK